MRGVGTGNLPRRLEDCFEPVSAPMSEKSGGVETSDRDLLWLGVGDFPIVHIQH